MLELTDVTKRFGSRVVLNAVSLRVAAGEYVAVVGESGIGKSTLLNIIAGLEPADAGRVRVDGIEMSALEDDAATRLRRERFGFVFQAFHVLPHLSVLQNVGLPLLLRGLAPPEIERRARALVAAVGLAGREASAPR
ncbi:MAG: ATP-binding cassette domain-containing protein, partial [Burkholderiales bacterium]|nr:ATP-binding cassette domain-containing protein [Burkholderiales bacterium]